MAAKASTGPTPATGGRSAAPWRSRITRSGTADAAALVANPRNWRTHPKHQAAALTGMLDQVGWVQQVIVNERTGHLVDGHLRVELAAARGEAEVPVIYVDLSPEEEALVLASLDPLAELAGRDRAKLQALLADVSIESDDLAAMLGRLAPRIGRTDPDHVPPPPAEPTVKTGELWILGNHRLVVGDATDPAAVELVLGGAKPTLLVTDPPYGVQLDMTWRDKVYNAMGPSETPYMRQPGVQNTSISGDTRVDWSEAFELVPSLEVGYVWHAGAYAAEVAQGLERIGFEIVSQVVWDKGLFAMGRSWYHWAHEPCWVVRKPGSKVKFLGKRNQATIWRVQQRNEAHNHPAICCEHQSTIWRAPSPKMIMAGSKEARLDHPAQKPVVLYDIPILNHDGEVYDPFGGCGTSIIAAEQQGRRCYALELEPRYAQIIIERWQAFTGREAVRG